MSKWGDRNFISQASTDCLRLASFLFLSYNCTMTVEEQIHKLAEGISVHQRLQLVASMVVRYLSPPQRDALVEEIQDQVKYEQLKKAILAGHQSLIEGRISHDAVSDISKEVRCEYEARS